MKPMSFNCKLLGTTINLRWSNWLKYILFDNESGTLIDLRLSGQIDEVYNSVGVVFITNNGHGMLLMCHWNFLVPFIYRLVILRIDTFFSLLSEILKYVYSRCMDKRKYMHKAFSV